VYVNSSGVIAYLAGTAAESPTAPSIPSGGQKLAEITVAAGAMSITNAAIADRRKTLTGEAWITPTLLNGWVLYSSNTPVRYYKDANGVVHLRGSVKSGTSTSVIFQLPVGYRPEKYQFVPFNNNFACNVMLIDDPVGLNTGTPGAVKSVSAGNTLISLDSITFRAEA
jgi:hypothetical protein